MLVGLLILVYLYQIGTVDRFLGQVGFVSSRPPVAAPVPQSSAGNAITVLFNTPNLVYPDARSQPARSPLAEAVIADFNAARSSIDVAAFDFDLSSLTDALLQAHERGVAIRLIVDSENVQDANVAKETGRLQDAGIPITFQRTQPFMHNKFIVIDQAVTWTGSWNMTSNDTYRNNNNFQRFVSSQMSADYTAEFEQLFAGQFGSNKTRLTRARRVQVGMAMVEVYFSPQDGAAQRVIDRLNRAQQRIRFMTFSFTSDPIADAMIARRAAGVRVQGVFEAQNANGTGSEFQRLRRGNITVLPDGNCYVMHHKVIIIDDRTVITGSYNFTSSAERYNDENLVIIDDPAVAQQYVEEFNRVAAQAQAPTRCQ